MRTIIGITATTFFGSSQANPGDCSSLEMLALTGSLNLWNTYVSDSCNLDQNPSMCLFSSVQSSLSQTCVDCAMATPVFAECSVSCSTGCQSFCTSLNTDIGANCAATTTTTTTTVEESSTTTEETLVDEKCGGWKWEALDVSLSNVPNLGADASSIISLSVSCDNISGLNPDVCLLNYANAIAAAANAWDSTVNVDNCSACLYQDLTTSDLVNNCISECINGDVTCADCLPTVANFIYSACNIAAPDIPTTDPSGSQQMSTVLAMIAGIAALMGV
jgi:hypothetical protein